MLRMFTVYFVDRPRVATGETIPPSDCRRRSAAFSGVIPDRATMHSFPVGAVLHASLQFSGVHFTTVVWAKFQAMAEGARLATQQLWGHR